MRALPLLLGLLVAGCGYSASGLSGGVRLRILDNHDERRTHEFDLTRSIARELSARGVRVNAPDATRELRGSLLSFNQPAVVEGTSDAVVVGSVSLKLEVVVVDVASGRELRRLERVETASFSTARAETAETARQEVFDRLAAWAVRALENEVW